MTLALDDVKLISSAYTDSSTPEINTLKAIERGVCETDFVHFLRWVKVVNPPVPGSTGDAVVPFQLHPYVIESIRALLTEKHISVLKSRQIGWSTLIAAYITWYALFHKGANILLFSKGQNEAKELLAKARRIHDQLPYFLKLKIDPDSTEEIGFPFMQSAIKAFPSSPAAGISFTGSIVVCDEHAEHPYADDNYISSKPTVDRGAQYISIFTAHPWNNNNLATSLYLDARSGKNDFKALFFPYDVIPGRDQAWYDATRRSIPERELAGLTPDLYMSKNYPRDEDEALSAATTVIAFDKQALAHMEEEAKGVSRIIVESEGVDHRYVNIYRPFQLGQFYVAASDVSLGVGQDYNVTCIMNVKTGVIVADICDNNLAIDEFTYQTYLMLQLYKNPKYWPEYNLWGHRLVEVLLGLKYPNLGYRDDKREKPGWVTDEKSRQTLFAGGVNKWGKEFSGLIPAVNNNQITIYNLGAIQQFRDLIKNASRNGRIEAKTGGHDDYPIAAGICWVKKEDVSTGVDDKKSFYSFTYQ